MNRQPGVNLHRFLEGFGVKVRPYHESRTPRPANIVYGGRYVRRLIHKDAERCGLTIRCIQASNPTCFEDVIVFSVWNVIGAHFATAAPRSVITAFGRTDLAEVKERALRLSVGEAGRLAKTVTTISILLAQEIIEEDHAA
ncbi:hypothetical protein [Sinorhizobium sp. RAC02]|uniref:hypothetical protein n=1 Tax=Sinorhizobium sp. RAC02 TaxID=1842534 RepID=UPI00083DF403|nr:hypothetical protein [Sinorhizobium sp. RAC02]AOF91167.1 hypothetical protein BSY16_3991 [Sinorhizobium sp. RAC02]